MNGKVELCDQRHFRSETVGDSLNCLTYAALRCDSHHCRACGNSPVRCQASPSLDRPREDPPVVSKLRGPILLPRRMPPRSRKIRWLLFFTMQVGGRCTMGRLQTNGNNRSETTAVSPELTAMSSPNRHVLVQLTKNPDYTNNPAKARPYILVPMPGLRRFYPPRSWSTTLLTLMLVVLLAVLLGALFSQLHWFR